MSLQLHYDPIGGSWSTLVICCYPWVFSLFFAAWLGWRNPHPFPDVSAARWGAFWAASAASCILLLGVLR